MTGIVKNTRLAQQAELIAALATPSGGAIGILRLSGEGCRQALRRLTGIENPKHRYMEYCALRDEHGESIDSALAVFFAAPHSYTGEDAAELHMHGSSAVMRAALRAAVAAGARVAEPGEFTRRAFLSGKLKLSEAEAVMDEIASETERGAKTAYLQLAGALTRRVGDIEDALVSALAGIDAAMDYPDELEDDVVSALPKAITSAKRALDALILEGERSRAVRDGARVVIIGAPNAGKSTLLNALAGEERAIVTSEAGTTRDIIEAHTEINGVSVTLLDTAGLRSANSEAERIGVERAREAVKSAELVLYVIDGSAENDDLPDAAFDAPPEAQSALTVHTKADKAEARELSGDALRVSALTGENMDLLRERIASALGLDASSEYPAVTNVRHISALKQARDALDSALRSEADMELAATDIRAALVALGAISGRDVDNSVIDEIFAKFCVGK